MGRTYDGDRAFARFRGGRWRVVTVTRPSGDGDPVRHERRLPEGTTEEQAHAIARRVERELRSGWVDRPKSWDEAIEAFLEHRRAEGDRDSTRTWYDHVLTKVGDALVGSDPLRLTREDAIAYRDWRAEQPGSRTGTKVSPATIRQEIKAVQALQAWAKSHGWVKDVAWADAPLPKGERGKTILHRHEIGRWLRAAVELSEEARQKRLALERRDRERRRSSPERYDLRTWETWGAAAYLLAVTGLRVGELVRLKRRDIDLDGRLLYVRDDVDGARTKSVYSAGAVPIGSTRCIDLLRQACDGLAPTAPVFPGKGGSEMFDGKPFRKKCAATSERAEVPYCTPHGLRHTAATLGVMDGGRRSTQRLLRHQDARTTDRYAHFVAEEAQAAATAIGRFLDDAFEAKPLLAVVSG